MRKVEKNIKTSVVVGLEYKPHIAKLLTREMKGMAAGDCRVGAVLYKVEAYGNLTWVSWTFGKINWDKKESHLSELGNAKVEMLADIAKIGKVFVSPVDMSDTIGANLFIRTAVVSGERNTGIVFVAEDSYRSRDRVFFEAIGLDIKSPSNWIFYDARENGLVLRGNALQYFHEKEKKEPA